MRDPLPSSHKDYTTFHLLRILCAAFCLCPSILAKYTVTVPFIVFFHTRKLFQMNRKRYLVALSVLALAHALNGQTHDFDKYLQEHRIQPVVLNDPERFLPPGTGLPAAPSSGPERLEKIKLRMPGAKTPQEFEVIIRDGLVFLADDIALMTEEELELKKMEKGSVITASFARWTNGKIPYVLSPTHSKYAQIQQAIAYLNARTNLCIVPRSNEVGYIEFLESTTQPCYSFVGRTGGRQVVNINDCGVGGVVHELCHVAGLFHEHTRSDRDTYVILYPENILTGSAVDFARIDSTALDYGPYDYGSIMHYGAYAFSANGLPTIETIPAGISIGQRSTLSAGDIAGVQTMYPVTTTTPFAPTTVGVTIAAKDTQVLRTLLDMSTAAQIKDSLKVGQEVLSRIGGVGRLHKRQVEQAGFAVLKAPDIPSILVETAFISNPQEESRLRDPDYQARLVEALYSGIRRYFARNPALSRQRST